MLGDTAVVVRLLRARKGKMQGWEMLKERGHVVVTMVNVRDIHFLFRTVVYTPQHMLRVCIVIVVQRHSCKADSAILTFRTSLTHLHVLTCIGAKLLAIAVQTLITVTQPPKPHKTIELLSIDPPVPWTSSLRNQMSLQAQASKRHLYKSRRHRACGTISKHSKHHYQLCRPPLRA